MADTRGFRSRRYRPPSPDRLSDRYVDQHGPEQDSPLGGQMRTGMAPMALTQPRDRLGYLSTSSLILNKVIGSGIFSGPPVALVLLESKGATIIVWLLGGIVAWAGVTLYLEYGMQIRLNGGELYYIHYVWNKPQLLFAYAYSIMFICLSGSHANALQFGSSIITASTDPGTVIDLRVQKFIAIVLVASVCLIQAYSREAILRLNDLIAGYKLLVLTFMALVGLVSLSGTRTDAAAKGFKTPYGMENLKNSFDGTSSNPYAWGVALLVVGRSYLGYENANLVLEEVKKPLGDENRVFRRAGKVSMLVVIFLYLLVLIGYFSVCSKDEISVTTDLPGLFFAKVFGPSIRVRQASAMLVALSSVGNVMALTYAGARVKQEIARIGVLPYPEFWARTTHRGTPGPALFLHWGFSSIFIIASPIRNVNGYLVISTLFTYARTWVSVFLGLGLLAAPRLKAFQTLDGSAWSPQAWRFTHARVVQNLLTTLYILVNLFILVVYWIPSDPKKTLKTSKPVLPPYIGPITGTMFYVLGIIYWLIDTKLLPYLGYHFSADEYRRGFVDVVLYKREATGLTKRVKDYLQRIAAKFSLTKDEDRWENAPISS